MKVSKRKFNQGGYYENKTDFVLAPKDYAALGAAYDEQTARYIAAQDKAAKEKKEKDKAGIQAFENRTKVMDRHNGILQGAYDIWFDARSAAIADPTSENKQLAQQAYSQYSVIKENAVGITTAYQSEVNSLNKGELDAVLIGNRAQALIDAKEFNQPIPFQVENGTIMVPGSDGQPVEWSQSTFYNESSFGQNGREFIATRKAPGTDYMFAPLSDKYSGELQGSAIIFEMEGDRKKGINEAAVGAQVEQRLRSSLLSEPSAFIDATAQQYGAFNQNVENLTSEGMLKLTQTLEAPTCTPAVSSLQTGSLCTKSLPRLLQTESTRLYSPTYRKESTQVLDPTKLPPSRIDRTHCATKSRTRLTRLCSSSSLSSNQHHRVVVSA